MTPLSPLFLAFNYLKRNTSANSLSLGVATGWLLGMNPLSTLQWFVWFFTMFLLPTHLGVAMASFCLFRVFFLGLTPLFHALGYTLLNDTTSLQRMWAWMYHAPILPYTEFNNSVVLGSFVFSVFFLIPLYFASLNIFSQHRERLLRAVRKSWPYRSWSVSRLSRLYAHYQENTDPKAQARLKLKRVHVVLVFPFFAVIYFLFLFDLSLKHLFENLASQMNGAPIFVQDLRTKFIPGTIALSHIRVVSPFDPSENLFEIDHVRFNISWEALIRKKINIPEMRVENIRYGTELSSDESFSFSEQRYGVKGLIERVASGFYSQVRNEISENPLRHMATLARGLNLATQVEASTGELTSLKKVYDIGRQLDEESVAWDSLQKTDRAQQIEALDREIASVDGLIQNDVVALKSSLKLPNLDKPDLTSVILGPSLLTYLERVTYWVDLSRRRVSQNRARSGASPWRTRIHRGTSVSFGKLTAFPSFLIDRIVVHSTPDSQHLDRGKIEGQLTAITSDPLIVGKPIEISLTADFPKQGILGLSANGIIDHTHEEEREEFHLKLDTFPLQRLSLTNTAELRFEIKEAKGHFEADTYFEGNTVKSSVRMQCSNTRYKVESNLKILEASLQKIVEPIRTFEVTSQMEGTLEKLNFSSQSELGRQLAAGLKNDFKHPMGAIEDDLRKNILDKVHPERERLKIRLERAKYLALDGTKPTH